MAFNAQTPQRPLPGAYLPTPSQTRFSAGPSLQPPLFRTGSSSSIHAAGSQSLYPDIGPSSTTAPPPSTEALQPIERGAKTINDALNQEARYPELDNYVGQGISSDYDIPLSPAWAPFQKTSMYAIPDRVLEQYNHGEVSTLMGLFAELNHAWVAIDNALYLWDYTQPNPELIGFEDQPYAITAVRLVAPRPGVFISAINYLLVVATSNEIILIGLSCQPNPAGGKSVTLYQTRMNLQIKHIASSNMVIEGSMASGRIFFSGKDSDLYELTYQQEEKWFQNRCGKINHTSKGISALVPAINILPGSAQQEHVKQMVIDDSRNLLYTLGDKSTIKTYHVKPNNGLDLAITQPLSQTFSNVRHMVSRTDLIDMSTPIVSISPISANEAHKLHLMATTSTGCRLFFSATSSFSWTASDSGAPTSMQVHHVKFPPAESGRQPNPRSPNNQLAPYQSNEAIETSSKSLVSTTRAVRFAPGYCLEFVQKGPANGQETLFLSAPDSGVIARLQKESQIPGYREHATWMALDGTTQDLGLVTPPFAASPTPTGFGNEMAIQFDKPATEIAILTHNGVLIIRRRRLVDIFAAAIQYGRGEEGLEGEIKKFIRLYGAPETSATALAVACQQGLDVTADLRVARVTDPEIIEVARKVFIDFGGRASLIGDSVVDQSVPVIDNVRPSPRHDGTALYISRLVRSIWKSPVIKEGTTPVGGLSVSPAVSLLKLQTIQQDLTRLQEFLDANKTFIDGLAGPEAVSRIMNKQDEVLSQGEHRALNSLVVLVRDIIEGISFVLVLFDDKVDEIVMSLPDALRQQARTLSYEGLFATKKGKDLAKELVKAIVNRNIANGSNVDTIAEALRRRCGSFCSADDAIIFKAQEQLKKASEAGAFSELGRNILRESLRLFEQVASSLEEETLKVAVTQFTTMQFYAGAIKLALTVAQESDRGNQALAYIAAGLPEQDNRRALFEKRTKCYQMIFDTLVAVDRDTAQAPEMVDGQYTRSARLRSEAYDVVNTSEDEVFQNSLYDWYIQNDWSERLLEVESPYIIAYLKRKSTENPGFADLLWKYYAQRKQYYDAAAVQLELAKTDTHNDVFSIPLEKRIEYLSRAKANASTHTPGIGRTPRQALLFEISELLEVASIQDDILQRLKGDPRLAPEKRAQVLKELNGPIIGLTELFNEYADKAGYYDICLLIYQAANHRSESHVKAAWQSLILQVHQETTQGGQAKPYEAVGEAVRSLGNRLGLSVNTFPIDTLFRMLKTYSFEYQRDVGPPTWVVDTFLDLHVPYDSILPVLESMIYHDEAPFQGNNRKIIANDIIYVISRWFTECQRTNTARLFGSEGNVSQISVILKVLSSAPYLDSREKEEVRLLIAKIDMFLR